MSMYPQVLKKKNLENTEKIWRTPTFQFQNLTKTYVEK